MSVNFCGKCGAKATPGAVFCGQCGERLVPSCEKKMVAGRGVVELTCPQCGRLLGGEGIYPGRKVLCPLCNTKFRAFGEVLSTEKPKHPTITEEHKVSARVENGEEDFEMGETQIPLGDENGEYPFEWLFNGRLGLPMRFSVCSVAISGVCLLIFGIMYAMGAYKEYGLYTVDSVFMNAVMQFGGGLPFVGTLARSFMHAGLLHLGLNVACILTVCKSAERLFGWKLFLLLYFMSDFCGDIFSSAMHANVVSVGASGAIFGVAGAMFAFTILRYLSMRRHLPEWVTSKLRDWVMGPGSFILFNLLYSLRFTSRSVGGTQMDIAAHLGGLLVGGVFGAVMLKFIPPRRNLSALFSEEQPDCGEPVDE